MEVLTTDSLERYVKTRKDRLQCECACANSRIYLIGSQDGRFPRMGWHTPGEMSGLWLHPIKLVDGFWVQVQDPCTGDSEWLIQCSEYTSGPFWGTHTYTGVLGELCVTRTEYAPEGVDGIVVRYALRWQDGTKPVSVGRRFNLRFVIKAHLIPVWGSELARATTVSHRGSYIPAAEAVMVRDHECSRFVVAGLDRPVTSHSFAPHMPVPDEIGQGGLYAQLVSTMAVEPEGKTCVNLFIAGSTANQDRVLAALEVMRKDHLTLYDDRASRVRDRMSICTLTVPDSTVQEAFDYGKLSIELLERDVEGVGTGLCAGLPEYPWWFGCDSCFSIPGLLVSGRSDLAISTMRLLASASARDNSCGRIPHEVVTDGTVVNQGNTQETPHFISTVREVWKWTGDDDFLTELYPLCKQGFEWLLSEMDEDGDLLPEGYGIAEVDSLNVEMLDTAVHTLKAAESLADIAEYLGDREMEKRASQVYARLRDGIDRRFWLDDEGLYGDMIARPSQVIDRIKRMRERSKGGSTTFLERLDRAEAACRDARDDSERAWSFGLSLTLVLLIHDIIPPERRDRLIQLFESPAYTGLYGIHMTGSGEGAAMTISTGQMVMGEFLAGRPEKAVEYIHKIQKTADLRFPGYPSEYSPDKGCFVQAWSNYGLVFAVIRGLFGIDPHVPRRRLVVRPCLPRTWSEAFVRRLPVGDRFVDVEIRRDGQSITSRVIPCDGCGDLPFDISQMEV